MYEQLVKLKNGKSRSIASKVRNGQNQNSTFQHIDNRPETIQMQKIKELSNNSSRNTSFQYIGKISRSQNLISKYEESNTFPIQRLVLGGVNNDDPIFDGGELLDEIAERIEATNDKIVERWYEQNASRINLGIIGVMNSGTNHRTIDQLVQQIIEQARREEKENIKENQDSDQSDDEDRNNHGGNRAPFTNISNLQSV